MRITRYASVDDVGRRINPLIVHGQTHGAIAQGVGQAMSEQVYLDPDSGQPLTGSLMDYAMPRADTLPPFDRNCRSAFADEPAWHQGRRRGRHHRRARCGRQRDPRHFAQHRRARHPDAGHALYNLVGDSKCEKCPPSRSRGRGINFQMPAPILALEKISKRFGAIVVADRRPMPHSA